MNEHDYETITQSCISSNNPESVLITGKNASRELLKLYDKIRQEYNANWVDDIKNYEDLLDKMLNGLGNGKELIKKLPSKENKSFEFYCLFDKLVKSSKTRLHLFMPDIDKVFYLFDVKDNKRINNTLRSVWQESGNLAVYGSAEDPTSEEFVSTLGEYNFPFYADNFRVFSVVE